MAPGSTRGASGPGVAVPALASSAGGVLAVDIGLAATGWVLMRSGAPVDCGVIRTEKTAKKHGVRVADDDAERCALLARELRAVLARHQPRAIVAELPTGGSLSARAVRAMALSTGVVVAVVESAGVPVEWTTPMAGRQAATGRKAATKNDVRAGVLLALPDLEPLLPRTGIWEHVTDAAAAYLAARTGPLVRMAERP